jgi:hypothetical protein
LRHVLGVAEHPAREWGAPGDRRDGAGGRSMSRGLLTLACVLLVGAVILGPFRRRIGGDGGGSEKASVGAWWVIAGVVVAALVIYR